MQRSKKKLTNSTFAALCLSLLGCNTTLQQIQSDTGNPGSGVRSQSPTTPNQESFLDPGVVNGIDVFDGKGTINWSMVESDNQTFVYTRATMGSSKKDDLFTTYWGQLANSRLLRGAYHFYHVDEDPVVQADHFLATYIYSSKDLRPMLDIEGSSFASGSDPDPSTEREALTSNLQTWLIKVFQKTGCRPIIYTGQSFANEWLVNSNEEPDPRFADYKLWIAEYFKSPSIIRSPKPTITWGDDWTLWQYADSLNVDGISEEVDTSIYRGTIQSFRNDLLCDRSQ